MYKRSQKYGSYVELRWGWLVLKKLDMLFRLEGFTHILEGFTHVLEGFTQF